MQSINERVNFEEHCDDLYVPKEQDSLWKLFLEAVQGDGRLHKLRDNICRAKTIERDPEQLERKKSLDKFLLAKQFKSRVNEKRAGKNLDDTRILNKKESVGNCGQVRSKRLDHMYSIVNEMS